MKPLQYLVAILPFLAACSPTVDSTDERSFQRSVQHMSDGLDEKQRMELNDAIWILKRDRSSIVPGIAQTDEQVEFVLRDRLDGLTAEEVIRMGEPLLKAHFDNLRTELKDLQEKKAAYEAKVAKNLELLALFTFRNPTRVRKGPYARALRVDVLNGMPYAVSSFDGSATLAVPGRDVSLSKIAVKHNFLGGIQPGESQRIDVEVFDSIWDREDLPTGAQINLKLKSVYAFPSAGGEGVIIDGLVYVPDWGSIESIESRIKQISEQLNQTTSPSQ